MYQSQSRRSTYGRGPSVRKQFGRQRTKASQSVDPRKYIKAARPVEQVTYEPQNMFNDFALHELLHRNIEKRGFTAPSPIQDQAIPHALEGRDVLGIANTGTGKTAAFALPLLHRIMEEEGTRALVVAPTRELAQQIEEECKVFARGSGIYGALLIGGSSMSQQIRALKANPGIVIGTPGRIKDHIERGLLDLSTFNIVVLDEVDRMVDMGFIADIRFILAEVAADRQSYFFSATLDPKLEQLVKSFMQSDHVKVSVKTSATSDSVHQDVVHYSGTADKIAKLHDVLIAGDGNQKAIIFDETKRGVERLSQELLERGFAVDAIHGDKTQGQRQRALAKFKKNDVRILVATDVAARGIDVADITHVINYSLPQTYDDYTHRIGRAGRAGRIGYALTFIQQRQDRF